MSVRQGDAPAIRQDSSKVEADEIHILSTSGLSQSKATLKTCM